MTSAADEPIDTANEADLAEQQQDADGSSAVGSGPEVSRSEANEADALEQGAEIESDDDGYPHQAEEQAE